MDFRIFSWIGVRAVGHKNWSIIFYHALTCINYSQLSSLVTHTWSPVRFFERIRKVFYSGRRSRARRMATTNWGHPALGDAIHYSRSLGMAQMKSLAVIHRCYEWGCNVNPGLINHGLGGIPANSDKWLLFTGTPPMENSPLGFSEIRGWHVFNLTSKSKCKVPRIGNVKSQGMMLIPRRRLLINKSISLWSCKKLIQPYLYQPISIQLASIGPDYIVLACLSQHLST